MLTESAKPYPLAAPEDVPLVSRIYVSPNAMPKLWMGHSLPERQATVVYRGCRLSVGGGAPAAGQRSDSVFDEATPFTPSLGRSARVALNQRIHSFKNKSVRPVVICPSLIYGLISGPAQHSI